MRRERPEAKVIAMSGATQMGDLDIAAAARESGAAATLEKPFDPAALKRLLSDLARLAA